ncbi:MAG: ABC transporter ATP-binding protein [Bacteroidetes bacterium]|jgi:lipoprotein-releasing system ATP-binding protein|nr:ABC transporter ATP-binding protein [Bacteroidota bacterium]
MSTTILEAKHINKYFHDPIRVQVLNDINFSINKGEFVSLTGKSGCGKSTLLYLLSTMDTDYEGQIFIDQEEMPKKNEGFLAKIRNEKIGFVFQFHYLLNEFNVLKNVMLPGLKLNKYANEEVEHRAMEKLKILGIEHLALKKANHVSGGEKQRVAIARALINDPHIIMGDEPTGNLDKKNSDMVFDIFNRLSSELNQTLLIVTHDPGFAERTHRIIHMEDGRIIH